jgi:N-acetylmuramoyl-L-alanine amidase
MVRALSVPVLALTLALGAGLPRPPSAYTIAIDAGHGGWDSGTVNLQTGLEEKNVTLAVSLDLAALLRSDGFKVVMFRSEDTAHAPPGDVLLNLQRQAALAKPPYTLFVGIYVNSCPGHDCPGVAGPHTYYFGQPVNPNLLTAEIRASGLAVEASPQLLQRDAGLKAFLAQTTSFVDQHASAVLAQDLQTAEVRRTGWPNHPITPLPLYVLRYAEIPAALIEVGYMTDPREGQLMALPVWQLRIARSLAQGILAYLEHPDAASSPPPLPAGRLQAASPAAPAASDPAPAQPRRYTVRRGDTLFALSKRFGVSVAALVRANHLSGLQIDVGQVLIIP